MHINKAKLNIMSSLLVSSIKSLAPFSHSSILSIKSSSNNKPRKLHCIVFSMQDTIYFYVPHLSHEEKPSNYCASCYNALVAKAGAKREYGRMICAGRSLNISPNTDNIEQANCFINMHNILKTIIVEFAEVDQYYLLKAYYKCLLKLIICEPHTIHSVIKESLRPFAQEISLIEVYFYSLAKYGNLSKSDIKILLLLQANSLEVHKLLFHSWFRCYPLIIVNWTSSSQNYILREAIISDATIIGLHIKQQPHFIDSVFCCLMQIIDCLKLNLSNDFKKQISYIFEDFMSLIKCPHNSMNFLRYTDFCTMALQITNSIAYINVLNPTYNNIENSVYLYIYFLSIRCKRAINYFVIDVVESKIMKQIAAKYYEAISRDYNEILKVALYYGLRNYVEPSYSLAFEYLLFPVYLINLNISTDEYIAKSRQHIKIMHEDIASFSLEQYFGMFLSNFLQFFSLLSESYAGKWKYNNMDELADCIGQFNGVVDKYLLFIQFICALSEDELILEGILRTLLKIDTLCIQNVIAHLLNDADYNKILESSVSYLASIVGSNYKFVESRLINYSRYKKKEVVTVEYRDDIEEYYLRNFSLNFSLRGDISNIDIYNICNDIPKEIKIDALMSKAIEKLFVYKDGRISIQKEILDYIHIFDIPICKSMSKCDSTKKQIFKLFPSIKEINLFENIFNRHSNHLLNEIQRKIMKSQSIWNLLIDILTTNIASVTEHTKLCCIKVLNCMTVENRPLFNVSSDKSNEIYSTLKLIGGSDIAYKSTMKKIRTKLINQNFSHKFKETVLRDVKHSQKTAFLKSRMLIQKRFEQSNANFIKTNNLNIGAQEHSDNTLLFLCSYCKEPIDNNNLNDPYGVIASISPSIVSQSLLKFVILSSKLLSKKHEFLATFLKEYPYVMKEHHWEITMQNIFTNSHYMHYRCFSTMRKTSNYLFKCPACRKIANCLIPVMPSAIVSCIDFNEKSPMGKCILSFLSDVKSISANQSLNNCKYMQYPSLELRSKIADKETVFKFVLSFYILINRICYIIDSSILGSIVSQRNEGYKYICTLLKALIIYLSKIEKVNCDEIIDRCYEMCIRKFKQANFLWLLRILSKCLKKPIDQHEISIDDNIETCVLYNVDIQLCLNKWKYETQESTCAEVEILLESKKLKEILTVHLKRIVTLLKFFNTTQTCITNNEEIPEINEYGEFKKRVLAKVRNPEFYSSWMSEVQRRFSSIELCWYLIFLLPSNLNCMIDQNYITYFELCFGNSAPSTGTLNEKYICIACNKIISISKNREELGKYPCLIKHCNKCWRSHGVLINARYGRLLVITPFNGYEINLPYYNKLGMSISSYLEDSTIVIDVDTIKTFILNSRETIEILQCCISGDDINNTKAIRGGGYIEVFNLLDSEY